MLYYGDSLWEFMLDMTQLTLTLVLAVYTKHHNWIELITLNMVILYLVLIMYLPRFRGKNVMSGHMAAPVLSLIWVC